MSKVVVSLKDCRVLIAGGAEQPEAYDRSSGVFVPMGGTKLDGFCFSTATLLDDGRVLLAGGYAKPGGAGVNHAWLYEPRARKRLPVSSIDSYVVAEAGRDASC